MKTTNHNLPKSYKKNKEDDVFYSMVCLANNVIIYNDYLNIMKNYKQYQAFEHNIEYILQISNKYCNTHLYFSNNLESAKNDVLHSTKLVQKTLKQLNKTEISRLSNILNNDVENFIKVSTQNNKLNYDENIEMLLDTISQFPNSPENINEIDKANTTHYKEYLKTRKYNQNFVKSYAEVQTNYIIAALLSDNKHKAITKIEQAVIKEKKVNPFDILNKTNNYQFGCLKTSNTIDFDTAPISKKPYPKVGSDDYISNLIIDTSRQISKLIPDSKYDDISEITHINQLLKLSSYAYNNQNKYDIIIRIHNLNNSFKKLLSYWNSSNKQKVTQNVKQKEIATTRYINKASIAIVFLQFALNFHKDNRKTTIKQLLPYLPEQSLIFNIARSMPRILEQKQELFNEKSSNNKVLYFPKYKVRN